MSNETLSRLRERIGEVHDIHMATAVLHWDQEVHMPPKGAPARGRQLATLSALAHRQFTDSKVGEWLEELSSAELQGDDAKLVSETLHDYKLATKLPEKFVERLAEEQSKAYEAWTRARAASNFAAFKPHLQTMVEMNREKAEYYGYEEHPYDALLGEYERGTKTSALKPLFAELAEKQSGLLARIVRSGKKHNVTWTQQEWHVTTQELLTLKVLSDFGYDFQGGRQDKSVHPFSTNFDVHDVRITTRFDACDPFSALTGSMHECGHALYEQGLRESDARTTLGQSISLGIHESQSRMWENMIGRSEAFWKYFAPHMKACYPDKMQQITAEDLYHAVNFVQPSFIRVEADECTYNLHVILRFELEVALIEGSLAVEDVPAAWNGKVKQYLGLDVPSDAEGCLQDIHWSHGSIGYFPTYTLGNLYAAQFFQQILQDVPRLWFQVEEGNFKPLLNWLREHIHRVGRRRTATELVQDVTGKPLSADPYLQYLEHKFGLLYGLS